MENHKIHLVKFSKTDVLPKAGQFNRVKICHIASADITVKFLLLPQLKFLLSQGYDVYAVCSYGKWIKDIKNEGIKVKNIKITRKITPILDFIALIRLFFYFKKEKFDIVHTHTPKPGLLGQMAAKMAGVPVVINTIHGLYFSDNSPYLARKFFIFVEKIGAKCSDLIFSQNKEDVETMIKEKIAGPEKIKYLGNGVDINKFNPERFSKDFIINKKKELGLNPDCKIIGTVGRLVKEKGYLEIFEAFKSVLEKFPETLLLIIGPEEPEKKDAFSPAIVKNYGIENKVVFLGERTDIEEIYPLMDIFVLASHREGFPRTVIEAMAMSKPIVATDIRGCREAIDSGRNGILIPAKNPDKLAEALIFLLENPLEAKRLADSAKEKAQNCFDENIIFLKIKEEYKKLLPPNRLKICQATTVDITVRFIIWDFLKFLKTENCDISVVCSPGKWTPFFKEQGFSVHNIEMTRLITPFKDLVSLIKLFLLFRKEKFNIVHTHTPKAGILGRVAARMAGVPIVIHTSHGFYRGVKIPPYEKKMILFAEKIASYFCDVVFSINKEDIEWAVRKGIVNPKKIKLLKCGIDINRFNPSKFNQEFIFNKKKELGIENKKIIGMVGRFVKEKGYLDLFEAFKIIKKEIKNAALLLVAPADKEKEDALDKSILKDFGIEKDTVILGYEQEIVNIEEIYPLMDIFVLPSYREGFPYSIMEASASGKAVVATNIRGCRETVEDNKTGLLFSVGKYEALAELIFFLLKNPEKSKEMGSNGRKKAEKEFDERIIFEKIKEEYKELIAKKLR